MIRRVKVSAPGDLKIKLFMYFVSHHLSPPFVQLPGQLHREQVVVMMVGQVMPPWPGHYDYFLLAAKAVIIAIFSQCPLILFASYHT